MRFAVPARQPSAYDAGTHSVNATSAPRRTTSRRTSPAVIGLSRRLRATSRGASIQSLLHPTLACPHNTAKARTALRAPRWLAMAVAVAYPTTATVGPGCVARTRPRAVRAREGDGGDGSVVLCAVTLTPSADRSW